MQLLACGCYVYLKVAAKRCNGFIYKDSLMFIFLFLFKERLDFTGRVSPKGMGADVLYLFFIHFVLILVFYIEL